MCPLDDLHRGATHGGRTGESSDLEEAERRKDRVEKKAGEKDGAMAPSKVTASGNARRAFRKVSG